MFATLVIAIVTVGYCLMARRLSRTIVTAPMVFILLGFLLAQAGGSGEAEVVHVLHSVAEVALVVLLFLDAARTDLRRLNSQRQWPVRMLLLGMPLAILLGTGMIAALAPGWPLAAAAKSPQPARGGASSAQPPVAAAQSTTGTSMSEDQ
ncbi:cation:proton antiporter domain-containing protein [Mangrovicoccus ximenensis]|uniref:cation:proton antiporter domain-containing protein n=1 Tax=Mangrovicoccus ximenensis TaxID=1911570 RepID=UPI000D3605B8|nr:cation:proton antiporter [Mangrovicoccus ximenensis]